MSKKRFSAVPRRGSCSRKTSEAWLEVKSRQASARLPNFFSIGRGEVGRSRRQNQRVYSFEVFQ